MAVPTEFIRLACIIFQEGVDEQSKANWIGRYLEQLSLLNRDRLNSWNNSARVPITIPSEWHYLMRKHRSVDVSILQSLHAYARSLGLNLIAEKLRQRMTTPLLLDAYLDRNKSMVNRLLSNLSIAQRFRIVQELGEEYTSNQMMISLVGMFLQELQAGPDLVETLDDLELHIEEYKTLEEKALRVQAHYAPNINQQEILRLTQDGSLVGSHSRYVTLFKKIPEVRDAQEYSNATAELKFLLKQMAYAFFELLKKYSDDARSERNYYVTLKPRLEELTEFMGISKHEASNMNDFITTNQKSLDDMKKSDALPDYECELTTQVMDNPVKLPSGHYVDMRAVECILFRGCLTATDPYSRELIARGTLHVDLTKKEEIDESVKIACAEEQKSMCKI